MLTKRCLVAFASVVLCLMASCDGEEAPPGGTGAGGSGGSPTTTSSSTTTTTATGAGCEPDCPGNCGFSGTGCAQVALNGDCMDEIEPCQASQSCVDYATCIDPCPTPPDPPDAACREPCDMLYPEGSALYNAIFNCVVCENCPMSCDKNGLWCL